MGDGIRAALRYPTMVIIAVAVAMFIVNIFVIPAFGKMFSSFHAQLPLMTRILIGTSDLFVGYWPLMIVGVVALVTAARFYVRSKERRYRWDGLKLRLPVIGSLVHKATLARFSRSFALSAKSGVPIVQVLSIVAEVVDNAYLEACIVQMREAIERGESILRAAVGAGGFSPGVVPMGPGGEGAGGI